MILLFCVNSISAFNANLPYSVLSQCKEYQIDEGYNYKDAFAISDLKNNKPFENEIFRMKFYVFTTNDAHMLITNEPKAQVGDPAYEIGGYLCVFPKSVDHSFSINSTGRS